jgi:hypothetical protein
MVPDACAAVTPALHQAALTNLDNAFCNCRNTAEIVAEMSAAASVPSAQPEGSR